MNVDVEPLGLPRANRSCAGAACAGATALQDLEHPPTSTHHSNRAMKHCCQSGPLPTNQPHLNRNPHPQSLSCQPPSRNSPAAPQPHLHDDAGHAAVAGAYEGVGLVGDLLLHHAQQRHAPAAGGRQGTGGSAQAARGPAVSAGGSSNGSKRTHTRGVDPSPQCFPSTRAVCSRDCYA